MNQILRKNQNGIPKIRQKLICCATTRVSTNHMIRDDLWLPKIKLNFLISDSLEVCSDRNVRFWSGWLDFNLLSRDASISNRARFSHDRQFLIFLTITYLWTRFYGYYIQMKLFKKNKRPQKSQEGWPFSRISVTKFKFD